ncbi:MAG: SH3 domain-containing protein [Lachnospiraceae bacterium]|nr:SH3 domain-containing protein [Lachnospiraceae bacterium]
MKRKAVALLCAALMVGTCFLTACGKKNEPESNVTLREMTKYEHKVYDTPERGNGPTLAPVKDVDGFYPSTDTVYVTSNTLNIRKEPSDTSEVVATVAYGTSLERTGTGEDGWDRVSYENMPGYVNHSYVTTLTIQESRSFQYSIAMLSIVDTTRQIYSYDSMCEDLAEMRERFGDYMKLNCIGSTKDKRNIFEIVIGDEKKAKRHIFLCAGICGAEYMSTLVCMKEAEYYLCYYETGNYNGFAYRELSNNVALHIIPMLNPDGVTISQEYLSCVRSESIQADLRKWFDRDRSQGGTNLTLDNYLMFYYANAAGVDLRRNFDFRWDQINGAAEPGSTDFRGSAPGSEAETKALLTQLTGYTPDLVVTYHTTGATVRYRFGQSEPELSKTGSYAKKLAEIMNYGVSEENVGVADYGSYEGYCNTEIGVPALSVSLGSGKTPLSLNEFNAIWNAVRESWAVLQLAVVDY